MPQLDFFTAKAQLFCLLLSIFLIYSLLLKYAMPAYDVFLRLKIKKVVYYRLGVENLMYLSLKFKESSTKYVGFIAACANDFSKVYFNFLATTFPVLYYLTVSKDKTFNEKTEVPFYNTLSNMVRPVVKDVNRLERKKLNQENFKKILNS